MIGDAFEVPETDPVERARVHLRPDLPKRFYDSVAVAADGDRFRVTLDGRAIRSPGGNHLAVANSRIAEAVAEEWRAQGARIDPATMPLTRLVNSALDGVAGDTGRVRAQIVAYAGNDMLLYRAEAPAELAARQQANWGPVVAWAEAALDGRLILAAGIVHVDQPPATLEALDAALKPLDPLPLAALHVVTTLTGSALLALAVLKGRLDGDETWRLAHLDEDWNMKMWGADAEALARRAARRGDFDAAVRVLSAPGAESAPA